MTMRHHNKFHKTTYQQLLQKEKTWKKDRDQGTSVGLEECLLPSSCSFGFLSVSLLKPLDSILAESGPDGVSRGNASCNRRRFFWSKLESIVTLSFSGFSSLLGLLGLQENQKSFSWVSKSWFPLSLIRFATVHNIALFFFSVLGF